MEKIGEDEETAIEEARNLVEDTRSHKEDESIRETITKLFDPSNSHTVTFEDQDVNESDMEEDEKVLERFRRNTGLVHEVADRNMSEETEQASAVLHSSNDSNEIVDFGETDMNSPEEVKSSSASSDDDDTDDSSSDCDLDSSLSRYYFDGSLPVSSHDVEEPNETHQDESSVPKDESLQMALLRPKQTAAQQTSWRNCCGLLEILRAANP
ncbi:unnamed protein product [Cochlearia groenlandica]